MRSGLDNEVAHEAQFAIDLDRWAIDMLLAGDELLPRLYWHLERADSVDIATAFIGIRATKVGRSISQALCNVAFRGGNVRVIVGSMNEGKDQQQKLDDMSVLAGCGVAVREHDYRFHAKTYIFHHTLRRQSRWFSARGADAYGWVGSANLSGAAFKDNRELMVETADTEDVRGLDDWFIQNWRDAAIRKVGHSRPWSEIDDERAGLPVGVAAASRASFEEFRCTEVRMAPLSATSGVYWHTHVLQEKLPGLKKDKSDFRMIRVPEAHDPLERKPIPYAVLLSFVGSPATPRALQSQVAPQHAIKLRIGTESCGIYCSASIEELRREEGKRDWWTAKLRITSPLKPIQP